MSWKINAASVAATAVCLLATTPALRAEPQPAVGLLKICKKDRPDDFSDPAWWRREVVVPAGVEFRDVGAVADSSSAWIKLKVVTTQRVAISGDQKCAVARAMIPRTTAMELGSKPVGPIIQAIPKSAERLLEVMGWGGTPGPPAKLAPWADVVPVEATLETDFK